MSLATPLQTRLRLTLSDGCRLVDVGTARAALGVDAETVMARIESGELPFAFDLSRAEARRREVRVWVGCFDPAVRPDDWSLAAVCAHVLGACPDRVGDPDFRLRAAVLENLWCLHNTHVNRLVRDGELRGTTVGHTTHVWRASAFEFLQRRRIA